MKDFILSSLNLTKENYKTLIILDINGTLKRDQELYNKDLINEIFNSNKEICYAIWTSSKEKDLKKFKEDLFNFIPDMKERIIFTCCNTSYKDIKIIKNIYNENQIKFPENYFFFDDTIIKIIKDETIKNNNEFEKLQNALVPKP